MSLGNKQIMAENVKYYMNKKGIDRNMLCSDLGLKYMTVSDWINAKTYPRIDKIEMLANYFRINKSNLIEARSSTAYLTTPATTATQKPINDKVAYIDRELKEPRHSVWIGHGERLLAEQKDETTIAEPIALYDDRERVTGIVDFAASAGTGVWQDENLGIEVTFYKDDMAEDYDNIGIVMGHSMEPVLKNGDYLFVKITTDIPNGALSIWQVNGDNYVKKFRNNSKPYLESLNPEYDNIRLTEDDDIRPLAIVVDVYREG